MTIVLYIVILLSLVSLIFQDLKHRHIHVLLPVLLFVATVFLLTIESRFDYTVLFYNIAFFLLIFFFLIIYMSIKNKSFLNPFTHYFGLGDVLYFISISAVFILHNYILFFILSMLFSIVLQQLFKKRMKEDTVPLAGFSALLLLLFISWDLFLADSPFTLIR